MTKAEIFDKNADIIADRFETDRDAINEQLNFKQDLAADSIDLVDFVLEVEDTFGAEISDEDAEKLNTIGEVVDYIAAHQNQQK